MNWSKLIRKLWLVSLISTIISVALIGSVYVAIFLAVNNGIPPALTGAIGGIILFCISDSVDERRIER